MIRRSYQRVPRAAYATSEMGRSACPSNRPATTMSAACSSCSAAQARHQRCRRCCAPWTRCRASISSTSPFADSAYADQALPIACGQTISQPYVVAYMTEQLGVQPEHRVLEIGTGSGYQAAVLSRLAREVVSVERYRTLADSRARAARDARLRQCRGARRRRACRRARARAVRPHHRHRGRRNDPRGAGRPACRWTA